MTRYTPEENRAAQKRWREAHPAYSRETVAAWRLMVFNLIYDHYGRVCQCCGEDDIRFLTLDHVNGDGAEQRRKPNGARTGSATRDALYRIFKQTGTWPDDIQVLCYNCNCAKRSGEVCPHKLPVPDEVGAIVLFTIEECAA